MRVELHCHACPGRAAHRLLDLNFCDLHYIEALEHSAHIILKPLPQLLEENRLWIDDRLGVIQDVISRRTREKKSKEAETGKPVDYAELTPPAAGARSEETPGAAEGS